MQLSNSLCIKILQGYVLVHHVGNYVDQRTALSHTELRETLGHHGFQASFCLFNGNIRTQSQIADSEYTFVFPGKLQDHPFGMLLLTAPVAHDPELGIVGITPPV